MNMTAEFSETATFTKQLEATLLLEVEGTKGEVLASHLKAIQVDLHSYGYEARVQFATFDNDEVHQLFAEAKVMKATLTCKSTEDQTAGKELLKLQGIVSERSFQSLGRATYQGTVRVYTLRFMDPAQMSWSHHFPIKIFVDQTMKDVLDAEKNPLIDIEYDWDVLTQACPILAFSLEFKRGLPPHHQVSFYSFLMWYLHVFNGVLEYDAKKNAYKVLGKKSDGGAPIEIAEWMMTSPDCCYPEPLRYQERSIKHSAETKEDTDQENPNGFKSVRRDAFDAASYRHFPEQVTPDVQSKLVREKPSIRFCLKELSDTLDLDQLVPGAFIEIKKNTLVEETWCDDPVFQGKPYRLTNLSFHALPINPLQEVERPFQEYALEVRIQAESTDEPYVERPPFQAPAYPFSIPGKIFSPVGDEEQTTSNIAKQEKVPLGQYQVKVPLVADDKKVVVPFMPDLTSGQHYFPLCKDQQVMLAMYFQTAQIQRVLDWQPLARLPLDAQANQIVFASNGKDKFVSQKHEFEDGQNSVLTIKQSSSPDQSQTIKMQEKEIASTVQEKGKNTVFIQLHGVTGLLLQFKDEEGGVTHQSEYNATGITHLSEKGGDKSIIVQTPESISIKCKQYNVECDEAVVDAKKTITAKAANKIFLEAPSINEKGNAIMGG